MSRRGRWPGTWHAICDRCGFRFPSDELIEDWQGLRVCRKDYEIRHPQDFIRGIPDSPAPPWTRPEPPDEFIEVCDIWTSSPFADYGTADCMTAGSIIASSSNLSIINENFSIPAIADIAIAHRSVADII